MNRSVKLLILSAALAAFCSTNIFADYHYVYKENFENMQVGSLVSQNGWTATNNTLSAITTDATSPAGSKVMASERGSSSLHDLYYSFVPVGTNVASDETHIRLSFSIKLSTSTSAEVVRLKANTNSTLQAALYVQRTGVSTWDGINWRVPNKKTYMPRVGEWFRLSLEINTKTRKANLYVTDNVDGLQLLSEDCNNPPVTDAAAIYNTAYGNAGDKCYIDDFTVESDRTPMAMLSPAAFLGDNFDAETVTAGALGGQGYWITHPANPLEDHQIVQSASAPSQPRYAQFIRRADPANPTNVNGISETAIWSWPDIRITPDNHRIDLSFAYKRDGIPDVFTIVSFGSAASSLGCGAFQIDKDGVRVYNGSSYVSYTKTGIAPVGSWVRYSIKIDNDLNKASVFMTRADGVEVEVLNEVPVLEISNAVNVCVLTYGLIGTSTSMDDISITTGFRHLRSDFNKDNKVDFADFSMFAQNWLSVL